MLLLAYFGVISRILERLTRLETQVGLFWGSLEKSIPPMLKSYPTNMQKDVLLDKMAHAELTLDEAYVLRTILIEEAKAARENAIAYALALARLAQVIDDLERKTCK
jgi:hypothetical protein